MYSNDPYVYNAKGTKVTDTIALCVAQGGLFVKAPRRLYSFKVTNNNGAVRYLQLMDSTGATTTIIDEHVVPAAGETEMGTDYFTLDGVKFFKGITYGISTTSGTYTAATAADHNITARYR